MQAFSEEWAEAFGKNLNGNEDYRKAAATWEGSILMRMLLDDPKDPSVFLDLLHGDCRNARLGNGNDLQTADFVLTAKPNDWKLVLDGGISPIMALMRGKIVVEKGSKTVLLKYVAAAKELVKSAQATGSEIPEEWLG